MARLVLLLITSCLLHGWAEAGSLAYCEKYLLAQISPDAPTTVDFLSDEEFQQKGISDSLGHIFYRRMVHTRENRREYFHFPSGVAERKSVPCAIVVRESLPPAERQSVLFHELAHCRFVRFFQKNIQSLSWRFPAPIGYREENGSLWIDKTAFLLMSERYAVETEARLQGTVLSVDDELAISREAWADLEIPGNDEIMALVVAKPLKSLLLGKP